MSEHIIELTDEEVQAGVEWLHWRNTVNSKRNEWANAVEYNSRHGAGSRDSRTPHEEMRAAEPKLREATDRLNEVCQPAWRTAVVELYVEYVLQGATP